MYYMYVVFQLTIYIYIYYLSLSKTSTKLLLLRVHNTKINLVSMSHWFSKEKILSFLNLVQKNHPWIY